MIFQSVIKLLSGLTRRGLPRERRFSEPQPGAGAGAGAGNPDIRVSDAIQTAEEPLITMKRVKTCPLFLKRSFNR